MVNEKFTKALEYQIKQSYCGEKDLEYSKTVGVLFSPYEYKQYLSFKEDIIEQQQQSVFTVLPLKTFNSRYIYFCMSDELSSIIGNHMDLIIDDVNENSSFLNDRYSHSFYKSRLYSEIEGSVNVENIPTTRRRLKELIEDKAPAITTNDIIIRNMDAAAKFVHELPEFNKENLFKLYSILSKDCLPEDRKLKPGDYYRYDSVEVDMYHGCPHEKIASCMESLFEYANKLLTGVAKDSFERLYYIFLPHICHYYILYIHPYFDYNGRTARMVSYWVYLLTHKEYFPPIVSEAINQTKSKYYRALEETRNSNNDISFFLKYIFLVSIDYTLCYKNLDVINTHCKNKGVVLTDTEMNYVKKILISCKDNFTYTDFLKACNIEMSKQGALKILNKFVECDILVAAASKSKVKLFKINDNVVVYKMKTIN